LAHRALRSYKSLRAKPRRTARKYSEEPNENPARVIDCALCRSGGDRGPRGGARLCDSGSDARPIGIHPHGDDCAGGRLAKDYNNLKAKLDAEQADLKQKQDNLAQLKAKFAALGGVEEPKTPAPPAKP